MFFSAFLNAQREIAPNYYCVYFKDKAGTPYSIDKPEDFLSKKAIERRLKYDIKITRQDLPVNPEYLKKLKNTGVEIKNVSKWLNCAIIYTENKSLLKEIKKLSFVSKDFVHPKKIYSDEIQLLEPANDIKVKKEKLAKKYKYGKGSNQAKMLNVDYLHNKGFCGQGMTIAIMDNGFFKVDELPAFDSIRANNQILGWQDFVDGDSNVWKDGSHGMMVLSTIASNMPGTFVGTAPMADFWLIRTENDASEYVIEEYTWVCGAEFADSVGADMIHSSLGYHDFDDDAQDYSFSDLDGNTAICTIGSDIAASKGILLTTSAGNSGADAWGKISAPADADSCLAIGACWRRGKPAWFSSRGPSYDKRVKPNITAKGVLTTVQGTNGKLSKSFGTSLSGPVMAGSVACLWQAFPELNNMQIIDAVQQTADHADAPDIEVGYGLPDFEKAYFFLKEKYKK